MAVLRSVKTNERIPAVISWTSPPPKGTLSLKRASWFEVKEKFKPGWHQAWRQPPGTAQVTKEPGRPPGAGPARAPTRVSWMRVPPAPRVSCRVRAPLRLVGDAVTGTVGGRRFKASADEARSPLRTCGFGFGGNSAVLQEKTPPTREGPDR